VEVLRVDAVHVRNVVEAQSRPDLPALLNQHRAVKGEI
jgi:hypothetical protein